MKLKGFVKKQVESVKRRVDPLEKEVRGVVKGDNAPQVPAPVRQEETAQKQHDPFGIKVMVPGDLALDKMVEWADAVQELKARYEAAEKQLRAIQEQGFDVSAKVESAKAEYEKALNETNEKFGCKTLSDRQVDTA